MRINVKKKKKKIERSNLFPEESFSVLAPRSRARMIDSPPREATKTLVRRQGSGGGGQDRLPPPDLPC